MRNNPNVSVIIPSYNHTYYLDESIQGVLNQTFLDFEIIILDDKSTDNSLEIFNKYKDNPHISQIVVNVINSVPPFKRRHKGFDFKGNVIWNADSDDSCSRAFLERLVPSHQKEELLINDNCVYGRST